VDLEEMRARVDRRAVEGDVGLPFSLGDREEKLSRFRIFELGHEDRKELAGRDVPHGCIPSESHSDTMSLPDRDTLRAYA
jgi:hypothetical protein